MNSIVQTNPHVKPMTDALRQKIQMYIKNGIDISDLIDGVIIKGENLKRAIIKRIDRAGDNISNCNLSFTVIGEEGKEVNFSGCRMRNVNFQGMRALGKFIARNADCKGCNLTQAWIPYIEYQYADLRFCTFCDTVMRIGSRAGKGAIFDANLFRELSKFWGVKVKVEGEIVNDQP